MLEHRADDQGIKLWEVVENRGRVKDNSWRERREERAMTRKRSLDAEQGQRFRVCTLPIHQLKE